MDSVPRILAHDHIVSQVCDFGLSRVRQSTWMSAKSQAGTPEWTAPEVLRSQQYNEKSDVYSFGVILWELIMNQEPWQDKTAMQASMQLAPPPPRPVTTLSSTSAHNHACIHTVHL